MSSRAVDFPLKDRNQVNTFIKALRVDYDVKTLFDYHERAGVLKRLTPPWINADIIKEPENLQPGISAVVRLKKSGFSLKWIARHTEYKKDECFRDIQIKGPFRSWEHSHYFKKIFSDCSKLTDYVRYELPVSAISDILAEKLVRKELKKMFAYRHAITKNDLEIFNKYNLKTKKILISGTGGVIGSELATLLKMMGHNVYKLVRRKSNNENEIVYAPYSGYISSSLEGFDIIIHLAGDPIGKGRWTAKKKNLIAASRIDTTRFLVEQIKKLNKPPEVFFCASAIGYYGDRGDVKLDEDHCSDKSFISELCCRWENEALKLQSTTRVVLGRFGIVLTLKGGALKEYYNFYRWFLGFQIGSGEQWLSWISLDDALYSIVECIFNNDIEGAVNIVSNNPVQQKEFARILGRFIKRPVLLKLPESFINRLFGQKGKEILLSGNNVLPVKLNKYGHRFFYDDLRFAFEHLMGGENDAQTG